MNMSDMFVFEQSPWEQTRQTLRQGDTISGAHLLALLEEEDEEVVAEAFETLERLHITPDIGDVPIAPGIGEAAVRLRQEQQLAQMNDMRTGLNENDPLRLYLDEILERSVGPEPEMLARRAADGDAQAQTALLEMTLPRVVELARDYVGHGVLLLDLIQEGSMGLWQCVLHTEGVWSCRERDWWIRHYMIRAVIEQARSCGVGQRVRQSMEDYRAVDERLLTELGRSATQEEIAQQLHISPEETENLAQMIAAARRLAQARSEREEPETEQVQEEEQAVEDTAYFQMRQRIAELLSVLPDADAQLLRLRYGLDGGVPMSPEQTGQKLGLTPAEVVTREAAALAKMRRNPEE